MRTPAGSALIPAEVGSPAVPAVGTRVGPAIGAPSDPDTGHRRARRDHGRGGIRVGHQQRAGDDGDARHLRGVLLRDEKRVQNAATCPDTVTAVTTDTAVNNTADTPATGSVVPSHALGRA